MVNKPQYLEPSIQEAADVQTHRWTCIGSTLYCPSKGARQWVCRTHPKQIKGTNWGRHRTAKRTDNEVGHCELLMSEVCSCGWLVSGRVALPRGHVPLLSYRTVFCVHLLSLLKTIVDCLSARHVYLPIPPTDPMLQRFLGHSLLQQS